MLAGVIGLVVERTRTLAFVSNLDAGPFRRAVLRLARRRELEALRAVVADAKPAWAARCAWPLVDPAADDLERLVDVEERLMDIKDAATNHMRTLRASATIASALGFIGAAVEIWWIFNGEHGLAGLEAGRVETEGLTRAVLSIALGIAGSSLALGTWTILRRVARERVLECRRLVTSLEEAMAKAGPQITVESSDEQDRDT